ncbi:MAG: hypothetical protein PHQ62_03635 [Clostridia bacterium]|nr:hypothetical protein [Clostridia bacterium]
MLKFTQTDKSSFVLTSIDTSAPVRAVENGSPPHFAKMGCWRVSLTAKIVDKILLIC